MPYRQALDQVERGVVERAFTSGNVALGVLDEATFGVPLGWYYLTAGIRQGVASLAEGEYERAAHELTPAALLVALYAGGKGMGVLAGQECPAVVAGEAPLQALMGRMEELRGIAQRLKEQLGAEGVEALARYLQTDPEAALLVAEGGEEGARALGEMRGDVPRARAWLSRAQGEKPGGARVGRGVGAGSVLGEAAALAEEGPPPEVMEARLLEAEGEVTGARLSRDVEVLRKQLAALREAPPTGAVEQPLWNEYLGYGEERLGDLERGTKVKKGRAVEAPLQWEGYQRMRGLVTRGLRFEQEMVKLLREDAERPRAERRFLGEFDKPRVEAFVGVWKPETGLRFADVLVIEEGESASGTPRVETFSLKSRDLAALREDMLRSKVKADASAAMAYYGEKVDIRRPSLQSFLPKERGLPVARVRLIYEGGELKPMDVNGLDALVKRMELVFPGLEVLFQ